MAIMNETYIVNERGLRMYNVEWLPKDTDPIALVFICHGYCEHMHSGYFSSLVEPLNSVGCLVSGHDYTGHGRSEGRRGYFRTFNEPARDVIMLVKILKKRYILPTFLFGYSIGGLIAIVAIVTCPEIFDGLILESAALDYNREMVGGCTRVVGLFLGYCCPCFIIKKFTDCLSLGDPHRVHALDAGTGKTMFNAVSNISKHFDKIKIPIFIAHGKLDLMVPIDGAVKLYNTVASSDKTIFLYTSSGHEIRYDDILDAGSFIRELKNWIIKRL